MSFFAWNKIDKNKITNCFCSSLIFRNRNIIYFFGEKKKGEKGKAIAARRQKKDENFVRKENFYSQNWPIWCINFVFLDASIVCLFVCFFCSVNASFVDFKLNDFVTLMQRYMQQHNEVELSALGMGTSP